MDTNKKKLLQANGWKIGSADEFLGVTDEESEYIELRLSLAKNLAEMRKKKKLTQIQLAKKINSSQSRVAKMEKGDPSVSLDLMIRSLLALGATRETLGKMMI